MMTSRINIVTVAVLVLLGGGTAAARAERQMEPLGRGVVAISGDHGEVFVSWRLLATDPDDIAFNLYRSTGEKVAC